MAPLDNYDRGSWFIDDDRPIIDGRKKKVLRFADECPTNAERRQEKTKAAALAFKKFLLTCVESVDNTCIKYCCKGSPVVDEDEFAVRRRSGYVGQLEPINIPASLHDVQVFADKGGFYDGTFALDDEDLWDASTILTELQLDDELDIGELDVAMPPRACPPSKRAAFHQSRSDDLSWWNYTGMLPSGKIPTQQSRPRTHRGGRREIRL